MRYLAPRGLMMRKCFYALCALGLLLIFYGCGSGNSQGGDAELKEVNNSSDAMNVEIGKKLIRPKHNLPKPVEPGLIHGSSLPHKMVEIDRSNPITLGAISINSVDIQFKEYYSPEFEEFKNDIGIYGSDAGIEVTVPLFHDYTEKIIVLKNDLYFASEVDKGKVRVVDKYTGSIKKEHYFKGLSIGDMYLLSERYFLCLFKGDIYLADMLNETFENISGVGCVHTYTPTPYGIVYSLKNNGDSQFVDIYLNGNLIHENAEWYDVKDNILCIYTDSEIEINLDDDLTCYVNDTKVNINSASFFSKVMDVIKAEKQWIGAGTDSVVEKMDYIRVVNNDGLKFFVGDQGIYRESIISKDLAENFILSGETLYYLMKNDRELVKGIDIYTCEPVYERRFDGIDIELLYLINDNDLIFLSNGELFHSALNDEKITYIKTENEVKSFIPTKWGVLYEAPQKNNGSTIYLNEDLLNTDVSNYYVDKDEFVFENAASEKRRKLSEEGIPLIIPPAVEHPEKPTVQEIEAEVIEKWKDFKESFKIQFSDKYDADFIVRIEEKYTYPYSFKSGRDIKKLQICFEEPDIKKYNYISQNVYVFDGSRKNLIGSLSVSGYSDNTNKLITDTSFQTCMDMDTNLDYARRKEREYSGETEVIICHLTDYDLNNNTIMLDEGVKADNSRGAQWAAFTDGVFEKYSVDDDVIITVHPYWQIETTYIDKEDFARDLDAVINMNNGELNYFSFYVYISNGKVVTIHAAGIC